MMKSNHPYEPHLAIRDFSVPAGEEWVSRFTGWSVIQIAGGAGYCLHPQSNQELETGTVILMAQGVNGTIRASRLGGLSLCAFSVMPVHLTGLITLPEQNFLAATAGGTENSIQLLPPDSPVAAKMSAFLAGRNRDGLMLRLKLLQFFVEIVGDDLSQTRPDGATADARQRLQTLLKQTPLSELLEMDFNGIARQIRCTPRHLSRIFHELVGMSFLDKRAELRLARARELLATTNSKIVDVALESGYTSLSLFNLMFARRFGTSPGRWRQKNETKETSLTRQGSRARRF
jgi:AraC-like DNA-binding protein